LQKSSFTAYWRFAQDGPDGHAPAVAPFCRRRQQGSDSYSFALTKYWRFAQERSSGSGYALTLSSPVRTRALTTYWRFAQDTLDGRATALPPAARGARDHSSLRSHPLQSPLIRATPSYPLVPCPYTRCALRVLARFAQDTLDGLARDHSSLRSQNTGASRKTQALRAGATRKILVRATALTTFLVRAPPSRDLTKNQVFFSKVKTRKVARGRCHGCRELLLGDLG
jgi:hypothetical protein